MPATGCIQPAMTTSIARSNAWWVLAPQTFRLLVYRGLRLVSVPLLFGGTIIIAGCSSTVGPAPYQLPPPDTSSDPARLAVGALQYMCETWQTLRAPPPDSQLIVDVAFRLYSLSTDQTRPSSQHAAKVRSAGGEILYAFHHPAYRIRIAAAKVPKLAAGDSVVVFSVPNLTRYDWRVTVMFAEHVVMDDGKYELIRQLGGQVVTVWPALKGLSADLPDRAISSLRGRSDVVSVSPEGLFCR